MKLHFLPKFISIFQNFKVGNANDEKRGLFPTVNSRYLIQLYFQFQYSKWSDFPTIPASCLVGQRMGPVIQRKINNNKLRVTEIFSCHFYCFPLMLDGARLNSFPLRYRNMVICKTFGLIIHKDKWLMDFLL